MKNIKKTGWDDHPHPSFKSFFTIIKDPCYFPSRKHMVGLLKNIIHKSLEKL
jgi:hypothetical protein